jgi:hypothetical protein
VARAWSVARRAALVAPLLAAVAAGCSGSSSSDQSEGATQASCQAAVDAAASPNTSEPGSVRAGRIIVACPSRRVIDGILRSRVGPEDVAQEESLLTAVCEQMRPAPQVCADFTHD